MPKKILEDMVRVKKREQIPKKVLYPKTERKIETKPVERIDYNNQEHNNYSNIESNKKRSANGSRYGLWGVAVVSVLFLLFSFSFLFSGATVLVNPRVEQLALNQNFSAIKDGASDSLPFDLVVISGEESKDIPAGEEKDVSLNAEGVAVIYNTFSSASQILSINTQLEGSNGKIYKTKIKTTVPGMKGNIPGSVEVEIYGSKAGEEYNSAPLDFKILGFKGTPKYSKFYGRSKGEITGGFIGKQGQISESDKAKLLEELTATLQAKLSKKAADQIPSGFILFKNAAILHIDEENFNAAVSAGNTVPVSIKGTLYGILFEEKVLTKKIIEKSFPGEEQNEIYIKNIRDLTFFIRPNISDPAEMGLPSLGDIKNINFNLFGTGSVIWKVDEAKLLGDILGKKKKDFNSILSQYPNIISANLSLRPFWNQSLPDKKENMKIIVSYPE